MDFIFDPSLVLYLPFYKLGGASFMSKDKHGHLCTVTGAVWTPGGRLFDGLDDKINVGRPSVLDITGAIALEVWFKYTNQGSLFDKLSIGAANAYALYANATSLQLELRGLGDGRLQLSTTDHTDGAWHHLLGTYDGSSATYIYFDGELLGTESDSGSISVAAVDLYVGARPRSTGDDNFFKGTIGEARIYNRYLTPLESQHNYLATKWRYR